MKIFLTGGTGFIGKEFIRQATKEGNYIFATTRKRTKRKIKNVKWLVGPFEKNWKELKNSDVLVHLAAVGTYEKYASFKKCNTVNVIKASKLLYNAINANCSKLIIIGTGFEYQFYNRKQSTLEKNKTSAFVNYSLSKFKFSKICFNVSKKLKAKCRIVKLFHVYGKGEKKSRLYPSLIKAAKNGKDFLMTNGNQRRNFSKVENVAKGILSMINFRKNEKNFPQIWDLASDKNLSVKSFAKKIWKEQRTEGKLIFNKIKNYDANSYLPNKKIIWKIN